MADVSFRDVPALAKYLRMELETKKFILLYAYNGTGKTRLSGVFKDIGKKVDESGVTIARERSISMPSPKTCSIGTTT